MTVQGTFQNIRLSEPVTVLEDESLAIHILDDRKCVVSITNMFCTVEKILTYTNTSEEQ